MVPSLPHNLNWASLTQNWALEIFSITPYITFKHIKGKDSADSLTRLQRTGLYEKCPNEEGNQDQEITIFDEGESIKVAVNPDQTPLHPQPEHDSLCN